MLVYCRGRLRRARKSDIKEAVYALVSSIPPGRVATYGCLSRLLGVSPRLVAWALKSNRRPIVVPCHRVVHSDMRLGGYTPGGARVKEALLRLEGVEVVDGRVPRAYLADLCREA